MTSTANGQGTARSLEGEVAVVTGSTGGIGVAAVHELALAGARVVVTGRRGAEGEAVAAAIRAEGGDAIFIRADLTVEEEVANLFSGAAAEYGPVTILVNNAAPTDLVGPSNMDGRLCDVPPDKFDFIMRVGITAAYLCCYHAIPMMKEAGHGSIINVSSVAGVKAAPGCLRMPPPRARSRRSPAASRPTTRRQHPGQHHHRRLRRLQCVGAQVRRRRRDELGDEADHAHPVRRAGGHRPCHSIPGVVGERVHHRFVDRCRRRRVGEARHAGHEARGPREALTGHSSRATGIHDDASVADVRIDSCSRYCVNVSVKPGYVTTPVRRLQAG